MFTQILAWLGSVAFLQFLKEIGKWIWGYVHGVLKTMWDNAWVLAWASACTTIFLVIVNMLNGWFAFPALLNIGLHGIYHLTNVGWIITNWKSSPTNTNNSGPKVEIK